MKFLGAEIVKKIVRSIWMQGSAQHCSGVGQGSYETEVLNEHPKGCAAKSKSNVVELRFDRNPINWIV